MSPWEVFHRLWTLDAGTPSYNYGRKKMWMALEAFIPGPAEKMARGVAWEVERVEKAAHEDALFRESEEAACDK